MTTYRKGWFHRIGNTTAHFYGTDQQTALCGMVWRKASHFGRPGLVNWPKDFLELEEVERGIRRCGACRQKLRHIQKKGMDHDQNPED
jgi:hypothetical protein